MWSPYGLTRCTGFRIVGSRIHNPVFLFVVLAVSFERLSESKSHRIVVGASDLRSAVVIVVETGMLKLTNRSDIIGIILSRALGNARLLGDTVGHEQSVGRFTGDIQNETPIDEGKWRVLRALSSYVCYGKGIRSLTSSPASACASSNSSWILIKNSALGCVP